MQPDLVTGLARREELLVRGPGLLARAADLQRPAALLVLDLDGFKELNDLAGHHAGDRVLTEVGSRLRAVANRDELVVRLGGDEFAILITGPGALEAGPRRSQDVIDALSTPVDLDELTLGVKVSVGLATSDRDGTSLDELLRAADQAMYAAKTAGSGQWRASSPPHRAGEDRVKRLLQDLGSGAAAAQLELHYQPQVSGVTGDVVGFEGLVRWLHDDFGLLTAREFVPLAERSGSMGPISAAVLELALSDHAVLQDHVPGARLSINVTRRHILVRGLVDDLVAAVRRHGSRPQDVVLEITEPMTTLSAETTDVFTTLSRHGFAVSIRGFGTARSSLTTLWHNPAAREVKVDPTIVAQLHDDNVRQLVRALTSAAHGLGIRVVAEGVEDAAVVGVLVELGCDVLQGYWISGPVRLVDLGAWCATWRRGRVLELAD